MDNTVDSHVINSQKREFIPRIEKLPAFCVNAGKPESIFAFLAFPRITDAQKRKRKDGIEYSQKTAEQLHSVFTEIDSNPDTLQTKSICCQKHILR